MLWLTVVALFGITAAVPLLRPGPGATERRRRLGFWLLIGAWAWCVAALIGYVALSRAIGCWREDSIQGDEHWTAVPFGQVCTYEPTEYRPAEVTQPGWAPTGFLLIAVIGAVAFVVLAYVNARTRTSRSVHSRTAEN